MLDVSQRERGDRFVLGAVGRQHTLFQPDLLDGERPEIRIGLAHDALDQILAACVVHPRDRDVRCELVVVGLEAESGQFGLDDLVQPRRLRDAAAVADSGPDHADVLDRGEDAEAADAEFEGINVGVVGGARERGLDGFESVGVGVAEEEQRQVRLRGIDEAEALRVREALLDIGDGVDDGVGEVDADEQSHMRS